MSHFSMYKLTMYSAESFMLLIRSSIMKPCSALYTAILRICFGYCSYVSFLVRLTISSMKYIRMSIVGQFALFYVLIEQVVLIPDYDEYLDAVPKIQQERGNYPILTAIVW